MNIASLSRNLYGHVYSALQCSYKIGISEVLYTFYFDITFFKNVVLLFLGFHNTDRDSGAIKSDREEYHNQIDIIYVEQDARGS